MDTRRTSDIKPINPVSYHKIIISEYSWGHVKWIKNVEYVEDQTSIYYAVNAVHSSASDATIPRPIPALNAAESVLNKHQVRNKYSILWEELSF